MICCQLVVYWLIQFLWLHWLHMRVTASQITYNSTIYSTACSYWQSKNQNSAFWPFVRGIHRWLVVSPHKVSVRRQTFPCHESDSFSDDPLTRCRSDTIDGSMSNRCTAEGLCYVDYAACSVDWFGSTAEQSLKLCVITDALYGVAAQRVNNAERVLMRSSVTKTFSALQAVCEGNQSVTSFI